MKCPVCESDHNGTRLAQVPGYGEYCSIDGLEKHNAQIEGETT